MTLKKEIEKLKSLVSEAKLIYEKLENEVYGNFTDVSLESFDDFVSNLDEYDKIRVRFTQHKLDGVLLNKIQDLLGASNFIIEEVGRGLKFTLVDFFLKDENE